MADHATIYTEAEYVAAVTEGATYRLLFLHALGLLRDQALELDRLRSRATQSDDHVRSLLGVDPDDSPRSPVAAPHDDDQGSRHFLGSIPPDGLEP